MTSSSSPNVFEVIKQAEATSKTDLTAAICLLEWLQEYPSFWPWGAYNLVRLYKDASRKDEARTLCLDLMKRHPDMVAVWQQDISLARGTPDYFPSIDRVATLIAQRKTIKDGWFTHVYSEILLGTSSDDLEALLAPGMAGEIIDELRARGVRKLASLIRKLRQSLHGRQGHSAPTAWTLAFLGGQDASDIKDGIVAVNLSLLKLTELEGWETPLAEPFIRIVDALLNWLPFHSDYGVGSWPHIMQDDSFSVIYWRMLENCAQDQCRSRIAQSPTRQISFRWKKFHFLPSRELWVRPGNVELWALRSYLQDRDGACRAAEDVADRLMAASEVSKDVSVKEPWWPRLSAVNNISRLNTNAGWYAKPGHASSAFQDWGTRYTEALGKGKLLQTHTRDMMSIMPFAPKVRKATPSEWDDDRFTSFIHGARIVLVSAFAEDIAAHHETGRLAELWRELKVSCEIRSLRTVQAPMSIWPYYPKNSWSESFEELSAESAKAIRESKATLFLASCGAYGLPLVHEMNKRFGIVAIYFGHLMNSYFGVYTDSFRGDNFYKKNADAENWMRINLARHYPAITRVDEGRYGYTSADAKSEDAKT